jgi:transcriptional regulator with XRE-family HTH domain
VAASSIKPLLERLWKLRRLKGWTQEEAAEACGIGYKYFQHIEGGRRPNLRLETLEKLAQGYGLQLWQLFAPSFPGQEEAAPGERVFRLRTQDGRKRRRSK